MAMVQDRQSKEESRKLLYQRVDIVTSTQDISNSTHNYGQVVEDYMVPDNPLEMAMDMWLLHINQYEWQYDNAFEVSVLFGVDITNRFHKEVQILLPSNNMSSLDDVETALLAEFCDLQWRVEQGEWITYTPIWFKLTEKRNEGKIYLGGYDRTITKSRRRKK